MAKSPLFAVADGKLARAKIEMARLAVYLEAYKRSDLDDLWSRTATAAYAIHGVSNGLEDIMSDIARMVDGTAPEGRPHIRPCSIRCMSDWTAQGRRSWMTRCTETWSN